MGDYFDREGKSMEQADWLARFRDPGYKQLASDEVGEASVSTVWLGLDHNWGDGPPVIFETMIFGGEHNEDQWRYSTEEDALAGHEKALALVREENP